MAIGNSQAELAIRMYRLNGLGDCFLLRLKTEDGSSRSILIDCGIFLRTTGGSERLKKIAGDILLTTGGKLDVLVATHEHWDHISGFYHAREIFKQIEVGQVWFGWTEDPKDEKAQNLQQNRRSMADTLSSIAFNLIGLNEPRATAINELMSFNGDFQAAAAAGSTEAIMEFVRSLGKEVHYLRPSQQPFNLDGFEGIRFYTLGPPTEDRFLRKSNPSPGQVYGMAPDMALSLTEATLKLGLDSESRSDPTETWKTNPFDLAEQVPIAEAGKHPQFRDYLNGPDWRKIDDLSFVFDSLDTLALKLDDDTNNTSLVLALELVKSGKILLFPGDAQVGSWESWQELEWTLAGGNKVKGRELLERTVFYKVGHHGSHNATLSSQGLELMPPDLTVMIPVHEEQAQRKGWKMPDPPLYANLQEKTGGRLLRMDQDPAYCPINVEMDDSEGKLWIEYSIIC